MINMQLLALSKSTGIDLDRIMRMTAEEYLALHLAEKKLFDHQNQKGKKRM